MNKIHRKFIVSKCENDMKSNCRWNPLRTRKNRSPRWDLNPQPSVIYADALTTELLEAVASKGEMWVFDTSCITQLQSEIIKSHLGLGSFRVLSGFHREIYYLWNTNSSWEVKRQCSSVTCDRLCKCLVWVIYISSFMNKREKFLDLISLPWDNFFSNFYWIKGV